MMVIKGTIINQYKIISALGKGGMGEVYLAEDTKLGRKVAVKILPGEMATNGDRLRRFIQEARAAAALNHPNIAHIYEIDEDREKNFIVMEFIEGMTLESRIGGTPLSISESVRLGSQIADALDEAHSHGIIHRDIKSANIMLDQRGQIRVLDFGLAKIVQPLDSEDATAMKTRPGVIMGTASYMSPEQARGQAIDARTDLWSLGVILYEMLSGQLPFTGETVNHIIVAILEKEPSPLDNVPAELQRIMRKALTKDKEMRYQTARDLLIDLKNLRKTLEVEGELKRLGSPPGKITADPDQENETQIFEEKSLKDSKAETTAGIRSPLNTVPGPPTNYGKTVPVLLFAALIIFGGWWFYGSSKTEERPLGSALKTVGVTSWSSGPNELSAAASFSPDGKMIAFGSARSGSTEIWVKPTTGGEVLQVTKNGFFNQHPVWSPNGQEVAYYSRRGGKHGIWRASFTGGEQTEIIGDIDPTARPRFWARSGRIYFQGQSDLFSIDEASKEVKKLTDFENQGLQPRIIEISPDETKIAISIQENELWKVKIKELDQSPAREIMSSKKQIDFVAWHPGNQKLYVSDSVEGAYQIFEVSLNGGAPVQLSNGNLDSFVEDVSSDGNRILYGSVSENSDLWTVTTLEPRESPLVNSMAAEYWAAVSPDGKSVVYQSVAQANRTFSGSIMMSPLTGTGTALTVSANGFSPVWSNNSEWIAFFRRSENDFDIWCARPTGDEAHKLTFGGIQPPGYTATPYLRLGINHLNWSPNSETLAYAAVKDGKSNIWLITPDGLRNEPLTQNEDPAESLCCPTWTPDGKYVIASSTYRHPEPLRQTTYRIWLYPVGTSEKRLIFDSKERLRFLGFSNEKTNAFVAIMPNSPVSTPVPELIHLYSISLETGAKVKINTLNNAYFHNIHLSPDRKSLAFVSYSGNQTAIWMSPVAGGAPRKLVTENDPKIYVSDLSWSPDGKLIVFGRQTRSNLLSMLVK